MRREEDGRSSSTDTQQLQLLAHAAQMLCELPGQVRAACARRARSSRSSFHTHRAHAGDPTPVPAGGQASGQFPLSSPAFTATSAPTPRCVSPVELPGAPHPAAVAPLSALPALRRRELSNQSTYVTSLVMCTPPHKLSALPLCADAAGLVVAGSLLRPLAAGRGRSGADAQQVRPLALARRAARNLTACATRAAY